MADPLTDPIILRTVAGCMIALRAEPSEQSPHVGAVAADDRLELLDVQAGYSRIRVVGADPPREGWVIEAGLVRA